MKYNGKEYSRQDLLKRVGDMRQIAGVRPGRLTEGFSDGSPVLDVSTGGGLEFTVLPGRGMDISAARYNGNSLAWLSASGDQHPAFYEPEGLGWLRSFPGGLLATCGLCWNGAPCLDDKELGLHGRIGHVPAVEVNHTASWEGNRFLLKISGKMRESILFGENLEMTRIITVVAGENKILIEDKVENMGYRTTPHMILYHMNFGFPLVDSRTYLMAPDINVTSRDADADIDAEQYFQMHAPVAGYREKCYFIDLKPDKDGMVTTALVNPMQGEDGAGVYLRWKQEELPYFTEWKMLGQGEYVVGMEPGNCLVLGRAKEREAGRLQYLEPGESRAYHLEVGILQNKAEIQALRARIAETLA